MELPLREQGTILTGIRGCDVAQKNINDKITIPVERQLVAFFRYCVMNPADTREVDIPNSFFQSKPPYNWSPSQIAHYPVHWYSHLMHCFEVVAYRCPKNTLAQECFEIYVKLVKALHLYPETEEEMIKRLSEDRIKAGNVVS
jgi:hypothetical protein